MPNIEVSEKAFEIVQEKARELDVSEAEIVEHMILEFSMSTKDDVENVRQSRDARCQRFIESAPNATPVQLWKHGFIWGWNSFQIRKPDAWARFWSRHMKKRSSTLDHA
jgi:hypothetical protein